MNCDASYPPYIPISFIIMFQFDKITNSIQNTNSILSLLLGDIAVLAIHNLDPTFAEGAGSDSTLNSFRFDVLGLPVDLPELLLHQLHINLMFMRIVHNQIT